MRLQALDVCGFIQTQRKDTAVLYVNMLTLHINWDNRDMKEPFNDQIKYDEHILNIVNRNTRLRFQNFWRH